MVYTSTHSDYNASYSCQTAHIPLSDLPVRLGISPSDEPDVIVQVEEQGIGRVGTRLLSRTVVEDARQRLMTALARFHRAQPLEPGMPREAVRREVADPGVADAALEELVAAGDVVAEGASVRLATHEVALDAAADAMAAEVRNVLRQVGFEGMSAAELEEAVGKDARPVVDHLVRASEAVKVGRDRYILSETWGEILREIRVIMQETGALGPAQLRDRLGLTRKYSIPLLEWLDAQGYTVRVGDIRRPGPRLTGGHAGS